MNPRSPNPHRLVPGLAVALAAAFAGALAAPALAQPESMATRVRETLRRAKANAVNTERPTQLNVTVGLEGLPRVKAIVLQGDGQPERHLAAVLARVLANPRDPADARLPTAAFYAESQGSDPAGTADLPHAAVELDLGDALVTVDGLAPGVVGARVAAFANVADGLPLLLASRDYRLDDAGERVLAAIQETARGAFVLQGNACSATAAIFTLFPGVYVVELTPRCTPYLGDQGSLAFEIDGVTFDAAGTPQAATLTRTGGSLGAGISGGLLLVPRLRADQLWTPETPGILSYDEGEDGAKAIDFSALHAGLGESLPCTPSATTLCLDAAPGDRRFEVTMTWHTAQGGGQSGIAFASPLAELGITSGGLLSFFPNNPEVLIKVLDACAIGDRFWVFGAPTTTLGFEIKIVDTVARMDPELTADDWEYVVTNADGTTAPSFNDTSAFATCGLP